MATIGVISYGLCAAAFAFLALLLLTSWRGGIHGVLLASACAFTALWAGLLAWSSHHTGVPAVWIELAEVLRTTMWLGFLIWILRSLFATSSVIRILSALAVLGPAIVAGLLLWQRVGVEAGQHPLAMGLSGFFVIGSLILALLGLVLLEQLYRNLPADRRWAMKFLCLGMAVVFAYDLYLYSDTLLFRQFDMIVWQARGAVQALAVPLIAIAATRNRSWSLPVFVSRHAAFHTATIVAAGGYLVLLAVGGYYIRDFGGTWGEFGQILLFAVGMVALIAILTSGDVRARLRVFLSKHFFRNKYDYREEWLRLTHRLAEEDDGLTPYERSIQVVADIVGSPAGAIWRHREGAGFVPAGHWRLDIPADAVIADDAPLIEFLRRSRWIIDMAEYRTNPGRYEELALPPLVDELERGWAVLPLFQQDSLTGFMLLCRPDVNTDITWEDRDLLKVLGCQIANYLGQYEGAQALSQARQFEAFNRLTAFLMHDLKNLIAQQSLVVKNAEKHKHKPAFVDDAMATIGNSVRRMERLLDHLQRRQSHGLIERVDVHRALESAARRCADQLPRPKLELTADGWTVEANPEELTMIIVHLIGNAQDATPDDGEVRVQAQAQDNQVIIEIADTGSGMTAEFVRDELFRPFHTTKSSKGMGIGTYQAREFVHRARGRVTVDSKPGEGTRFRLTLPSRRAESAEVTSGGAQET